MTPRLPWLIRCPDHLHYAMLLNRNCPNSSWLTVGIVYYHLLVVVHVFAGSTIVLLLAACSILVRDFACHSFSGWFRMCKSWYRSEFMLICFLCAAVLCSLCRQTLTSFHFSWSAHWFWLHWFGWTAALVIVRSMEGFRVQLHFSSIFSFLSCFGQWCWLVASASSIGLALLVWWKKLIASTKSSLEIRSLFLIHCASVSVLKVLSQLLHLGALLCAALVSWPIACDNWLTSTFPLLK